MTSVGSAADALHAPPFGSDPLSKLVGMRKHPWPFMRECMLTLDQADRINPIKRFPCDKLPYLKPMLDVWMVEPLVIVRKSRRMKISWAAIGFNLWDAMFHIGRRIFFVSDKEDKSDELVRRAEFVYKHIPEGIIPALPEAKYTYCKLAFPSINSEILGVAQGADQLRQETASRIFADEFAFWERARETYGAMRPTIEGGGQILIVSTSAPGFMRSLVEDRDE